MSHYGYGQGATAAGKSLEFMIIQTPNDTNKVAFRKQVRSHVTTVQHRRSRLSAITGVDQTKSELHSDRHRVRKKKTDGRGRFRAAKAGNTQTAQEKSAQVGQDVHVAPDESSTDLVKVSVNASRAAAKAAGDAGTRLAASGRTVEHNARELQAKAVDNTFEREAAAASQLTAHASEQPVLPGGPSAVMFSQGAMAARTFLFHDQDNVVGIALKHLRLDLSSVLATYKVIVQMQAQDFERNQPDMPAMKPGSTWQRFWEYIWTDPAIMIGAVLLTVTFRLQMWQKPADHPNWYHLLQLRGFLIHTINAAFQDAVRCACDQMLVAVALASAFEVKYSQDMDHGYHTHMKGLVKMVRMRGGLWQIQRSDPFVERFLLWHVVNTSAMPRGQNMYYQQLSETSAVLRPTADTDMFQTKQLIPQVAQ